MTTNPILIATSGSVRGTTFALADEEVSIGRDPSNRICIDDHSISRRHCLIKKENGSLRIVDLESYNGTFVNAVPIGEQLLNHGDQIAVGNVLFLFLTHDGEVASAENPVELSDDELKNFSTVRLEKRDALYLHPAAVTAALPADARIARDLNALLKISTSLSTVRDRAILQHELLQTLLDTIPADRAAILLKEDLETGVASYGKHKSSQTEQPIRISRSIAERVLREGVATLCVDVRKDESISSAESLLAAQVRSLACGPLLVRQIYVIFHETGFSLS